MLKSVIKNSDRLTGASHHAP